MSRVRFATARALYETFPEVSEQIKVAPTDQFPIDFLKDLVSKDKLDEAVAFCAYLLPRREAVWWACTCARASLGEIPQDRPSRPHRCPVERREGAQRPPVPPAGLHRGRHKACRNRAMKTGP